MSYPLSHGLRGSPIVSRRAFLEGSGLGFGVLALADLLRSDGLLAAGTVGRSVDALPAGVDLRPRPGHLPPQARAVILLMQLGGPSQMDLFDPKPELNK